MTPLPAMLCTSSTMDPLTAFNDTVAAVRSKFDSRIISATEEYQKSARIHEESSTVSQIAKRGHAFASVKQLHNEVKFSIEDEITKRVRHSNLAPNALDRDEIFWVVMNGQGERDPETACGPTEANSNRTKSKQPAKTVTSFPTQKAADIGPCVQASPSKSASPSDDSFCYCPYPECDWKVKNHRSPQWRVKEHVQATHLKLRYPCEAGCSKSFTSASYRGRHELKEHGLSVYRTHDKAGGFYESE